MLRIRSLCREYALGGQTIRAVEGIDLEIGAGESIALLGPSGSGKSTLMHLLGALDSPTSGALEILDEDGAWQDLGAFDESRSASYRSANVGFVFQSFHLQAQLSAVENVALPLKLAGVGLAERRARARALLERVGLGDRLEHRPTEMSGGQQQRVSIARALANEPRLLLADEPTGNLDSVTGEEVMGLFLELQREQGLTLVIVTHDPEVAARADRIVKVRDGRLEEVDPPRAGGVDGAVAVLAPVAGRRRRGGTGDVLRDLGSAFRRQPLRNALTACGIAVGGLAITLMVGLGIGLHEFIETQIESVNDPLSLSIVNSSYSWNDIIGSRASRLSEPPAPLKESALTRLASARGGFEPFTDEQVAELEGIPGVTEVRPRTFVIVDGVRLIAPSDERLDPGSVGASNRVAAPGEFEDQFYMGYTLVRGVGTELRLKLGQGLAAEEPRGVVISYQYAEAWGLAPRELVGRELELLFPDLKGYGKYQRSSGPTVEAQSGAFRAKVRGLTRKSILSSAVLLTPDFGEEITRFQFGDGRPSQSSGGLSLLADFDALRQLAAKPSLQASLNARGGVAAELSKTLASLGSLAAGAPQGGSAMLAVFQHFGRLRALAADATLLAALGEGSRDERALARRLRRLPGVPRQDDGDAGAAEGARDWGSRLKVRVARREQLEEVKRAIIAKGYKVRSLQENLDVMARIFAVVDAFLSSFGLIALFVAGLGIANTLIMAVYERTQEIGVMKAVGATQGQIRRAFAFEAAAIGLFGGVLGAASGAAAGFALNRWGVFYIAPGWDGFEFFAPSVALLIGTVGFCTLIGWLAGLYPAYRAARLDPIVALRRD